MFLLKEKIFFPNDHQSFFPRKETTIRLDFNKMVLLFSFNFASHLFSAGSRDTHHETDAVPATKLGLQLTINRQREESWVTSTSSYHDEIAYLHVNPGWQPIIQYVRRALYVYNRYDDAVTARYHLLSTALGRIIYI